MKTKLSSFYFIAFLLFAVSNTFSSTALALNNCSINSGVVALPSATENEDRKAKIQYYKHSIREVKGLINNVNNLRGAIGGKTAELEVTVQQSLAISYIISEKTSFDLEYHRDFLGQIFQIDLSNISIEQAATPPCTSNIQIYVQIGNLEFADRNLHDLTDKARDQVRTLEYADEMNSRE